MVNQRYGVPEKLECYVKVENLLCKFQYSYVKSVTAEQAGPWPETQNLWITL